METLFSKDLAQYSTEQSAQVSQQMSLSMTELLGEFQDWRQHQEDEECRKLVAKTIPSITKQAIMERKGGVLFTSCCDWLFKRQDFEQWQQGSDQRVLWISGDPGKGKTMMLCSLIEWFQSYRGLTYFFCVETDSGVNNQAAILRGLIYMITLQVPALFKYVRDNKDTLRLEGEDVEVALFNTLKSIIQDPSMSDGILLIDALDECRGSIDRILNLITTTSSSTAKWILSSRNNMTTLQRRLGSGAGLLHLDLDDNLPSEAVGEFVHRKLSEFATLWVDEEPDLATQRDIEALLVSKAAGTYLWVAIVLADVKRELQRADSLFSVVEFIRQRVEAQPTSLIPMYEARMQQVCHAEESAFYKDILKLVFVADRPLGLQEI
ncbi:hypothetical protein B0T10DRAFT_579144 [Thelonectria olida]|uniref:NACHT domain-containing protein n=1 Tax=Thelonectria olida TaxID=1576542 RepID=A0A9P9AM93_9HYPO|nr:hypothetical protein B0T10DRAFT_579144 [Thelonectria olida]